MNVAIHFSRRYPAKPVPEAMLQWFQSEMVAMRFKYRLAGRLIPPSFDIEGNYALPLTAT